ncbi:FKBP-type peptidyl-prolyl cis-trans isomerase FklB [Lutibacter agarilyticus]|uniref:Peptidyl-prolyl cis-trans isomerase n=1 Tax=Lutibacter agarilyticus TaxID=1109740 RepID=A0A238V7K1_9FLAO|nr:FKBP-type peptidyl-prolyl cis-trans isomerase [Lutibacter agarilyticus]SNR30422.1 FKBP-type peptidyl-prolyl cis-trans isomerase FklB [Lutibacter agarilyticus]
MKVIKFVLVFTVISTLISCNNSGITKKSLETDIDSASYALGLDIAVKLKGNFDEVDQDLFIQGVSSGLDSTNILIDFEKVDVILREFFQKRQVAQQAKQQEEALEKAAEEFGDVKLEGEKFLEKNKDEANVVTTESGLQYIVLKEGSGDKPLATSKVKVHYTGTLLDGTVFDSSVERGTPSEFMVNRVIKGWTEGLQLMPVGSKYKFFIPQDIAYGAFPRQGGKIRPFDALIFEVELIEITKK